ncbi:unnamed protein product [Coregonus sp. 'balchen']|nr:unnamed protein product [Coregonus sp. 'balchen']
MSSCFLDEETFCQCSQLFLQHSHSLCDGWSWEQVKVWGGGGRGAGLGYTELGLRKGTSSDQHQERTSSLSLHNDDDDDDDEGAVCCKQEEDSSSSVVQYEYHILYSCSYQTPVLYFRASTLEGRSLCLEEVWDSVHPNYRQRLQHRPWDTITQQEHPLLGQSFFVLHPCRTEEFMRPVLKAALEEHRQVNYIVTWLSVVGPVVGLDVPLSYCTQVPEPSSSPQPPALGTKPG